MIIFWIICALMLAIALAFILPPLLEATKTGREIPDEEVDRSSREANVAIYRDQLAEMEADLRNGIVAPEQYEQDRDEVERRLLEDVKPANARSVTPKPQIGSRGLVYAIVLGLPLLSVVLYLRIGNTSAVSASAPPSQSAAVNPPTGTEFSRERIEANVASLAKRLEQNPGDASGWAMLGRSYSSLERYSEASAAYAKATALKGDDAEMWTDYALSLAMANGQQLQGQPVELINKALKIDPENPKALQLAGSAAFEAKNYKQAIEYWSRLLARVPPNSEVAEALNERLQRAKALASGEASK